MPINKSKWVGQIPDETKLCTITIPGSHNSAARFFWSLPTIRCQSSTVTDQLESGVRFLDIRCGTSHFTNQLEIVHGAFAIRLLPIPVLLTEVLREVYDFLEQNSSETILISLKCEGKGKWNRHDEFATKVFSAIQQNMDKWYFEPVDAATTIGKLRGKCILVRRFPADNVRTLDQMGIDATQWPHNLPEFSVNGLCVQDFCELKKKKQIAKKKEYIHTHASKARESQSDILYFNFCNGSWITNINAWPSILSKKLNTSFDGMKGCVGIVVLDHVAKSSVVANLVNSNFQQSK